MEKNEIVTQIYRTYDYGQFKKLELNRDVTKPRVEKVLKSISDVGYILSPILINEKFEIIDGQARFEALKSRGLPIDYYIEKDIGIKECRALNLYQTNWKLKDYIDSYAKEGLNSYILLKELMEKYKKLNLIAVYNALTGKESVVSSTIKSRNFTCTHTQYKKAIEILDYENQYFEILRKVGGKVQHFYTAIRFCYEHDEVDNDKLLSKVKANRGELYKVNSTEQALTLLQDIYNMGNKKNSVFLLSDYQKFKAAIEAFEND